MKDQGGDLFVYIALFELAASLLLLSGIASLCWWYFHKRDIFPNFFILYALGVIILNLLLLTLFNISGMKELAPSVSDNTTKQIIRSFIYAAIWVPYVLRSENVKRVFVKVYSRDES